ncbi:MAG: M48 family metalloprotease [Thermoproteota archaeon]|nr:M48 family metalloprotease [Thermoproteota archaeon]
MFGSIPIAVLKLPFLFAFIPTAVWFTIIISKDFVIPNFRFLFLSRKAQPMDIPNEFQEVAKKMGTKLEEFKILQCDIANAFATSKGMVFTKKLMDNMSMVEMQAIAAHEIAHKKGHHVFYRGIIVFGSVIFAILSWSRFTVPMLLNETMTQVLFQGMMNLSLIAFMMIALIPASWVIELKADQAAARYVGKEAMCSALNKLIKPEQFKQRSETHPSVADRIKYIKELKI